MVDASRNSGSEPPAWPPCSSRCRTSLPYTRLQMGSDDTPVSMPTSRPRKARPVCERVKPWLLPKTRGKAPKNRYKIPRRMADNKQRFRHFFPVPMVSSTTKKFTTLWQRQKKTYHRLEEQKLERADARPHYCFGNGSVELLNRRYPFLVACFFAQANGLAAQKNRVIRLRDEEDNEGKLWVVGERSISPDAYTAYKVSMLLTWTPDQMMSK